MTVETPPAEPSASTELEVIVDAAVDAALAADQSERAEATADQALRTAEFTEEQIGWLRQELQASTQELRDRLVTLEALLASTLAPTSSEQSTSPTQLEELEVLEVETETAEVETLPDAAEDLPAVETETAATESPASGRVRIV